jgi:hypothetical protein
MRQPAYLSHSALCLWESDRREFYLKYLAEHRPPRIPQGSPAAAGSAFDAYVKYSLASDLGLEGSLDELFESQVESHNRDFGRQAGPYILYWYRQCGAYDELLDLLRQSTTQPRFESTVRDVVDGIPLLGKPDLDFKVGYPVVFDWKVRGFCSKNTTSPSKGYRLCRDANGGKPSKSHNQSHKDFRPSGPLKVSQTPLEETNVTFAEQLTMYGWLLGHGQPVLMLDEIVCKPNGTPTPLLRVANHRAQVSLEFGATLLDRYRNMWYDIEAGRIFDEDNDAICESLDKAAKSLAEEGDDFFASVCRNDGYWG